MPHSLLHFHFLFVIYFLKIDPGKESTFKGEIWDLQAGFRNPVKNTSPSYCHGCLSSILALLVIIGVLLLKLVELLVLQFLL
jgi:hypothetical protein